MTQEPRADVSVGAEQLALISELLVFQLWDTEPEGGKLKKNNNLFWRVSRWRSRKHRPKTFTDTVKLKPQNRLTVLDLKWGIETGNWRMALRI